SQRAMMIGATRLAGRRFLPASGALWLGARFILVIAVQFPNIDDVNINLTGVAFASTHIFTLSTFGNAIQARGHVGQYRASDVAIASRSPPPSPPTGFARGRLFTSKSRPHCHRNFAAVHRKWSRTR